MIRYQIVKLIKKHAGFKAVVVDNAHPSGCTGIPIRWFLDAEAAIAYCVAAKVAYEVIDQKVKP